MLNPTVSVVFPNNNFQKVTEKRPGDFRFFGQKEPTIYKEVTDEFKNKYPEGYTIVTDVNGNIFECWKGEKRIPLKNIPFTKEEVIEWEKEEKIRYPEFTTIESNSFEEYLERNPTFVGIYDEGNDRHECIAVSPEEVVETARLISIKRKDRIVYVKPGLGNPTSSYSKYGFEKGKLTWSYPYVSFPDDGSKDYEYYTKLWESITVK